MRAARARHSQGMPLGEAPMENLLPDSIPAAWNPAWDGSQVGVGRNSVEFPWKCVLSARV